MKKVLSIGLAMLAFFPMCVGAKELFVDSPNGKISVTVSIDSVIAWSACFADTEIIAPSEISMTFRNGEAIGRNPRLKKFSVEKVDEIIDAVIYKKREVIDRYNELKMQFRNYNLYFRAYDDGVAYRWETNFKSKEPVVVQSEKAEFCFAGEDHDVTVGYVRANEKDVYSQSFENEYRTINLKGMSDFWPAFAPILVGMPNGIKVAITDADLIDYPGMFLKKTGDTRLTGDFAPFVKKEVQGGHNNLQALVEERADYLAETTGKRFYPWRAVIIAKGEHLLLLNNDIEVLSHDFLRELLSYSQRPDVGAVGAKLYYPDDTIQHAGVIMGINGSAGHSHKSYPRKAVGDLYRLVTTQDYMAVTGACLMTKTELYRAAGGLDEAKFAVAYNDVDYCLKLWQKGLLNVYTPRAEAYHYESKSRGLDTTPEKAARYAREKANFYTKYHEYIDHYDPYYNPHFNNLFENFGLK